VAESVAALGERVFVSVLAPLVLGGPMRPTKPIGARAALSLLGAELRPVDVELASRVDLARVAQGRRLAPIDRVADLDGAVWALGAVLHDLLQAASPGWVRRAAPKRLLDLAGAAIGRVPPVGNARALLDRHTWFARLLAISRRDAVVSWWSGSREFRGEEPPKRLLAWSSLRRVSVERSARGLTELLSHGGVTEHESLFEGALAQLLRATPLTDLATCARAAPRFAWVPSTLAVVRAPVARTLALRAIALEPTDAADAALGRATRELLAARQWRDASAALLFLGHRAFAGAQASAAWPGPIEASEDMAFARAVGARVARRWLDDPHGGVAESEARRLAPVFDAAARGSFAEEMRLLGAVLRGSTADGDFPRSERG
jgi:hypothetical protein